MAPKTTFTHLYSSDVLVRIDLGATAPHVNPDGVLIKGSHIHLWREGYGCTWAYPLGDQDLPETLRDVKDDRALAISGLMKFSNIDSRLTIQWDFTGGVSDVST